MAATTITVAGATGALPFVRGERTDGLIIGMVDFTLDNSYPTGGEAIVASEIDSSLKKIIGVICLGVSGTNAAKAYYVAFDQTNGKLLVFDEAGETANTSDHSDVVLHCMYFGLA